MVWARDIDGLKDPMDDAVRLYFISLYVYTFNHCIRELLITNSCNIEVSLKPTIKLLSRLQRMIS